ncbi:hypothetical protein ALP73_03138 [Pseudomonas coronafaciens pv. garcae]|uniref:Uncharacterized protein n=4 Tax=Pseudomonas syringae group TaxID=136849 RepID=A0AAE6QFA8_9PSED|nr:MULTISPECIES: hypothetical protein [Pseudomonas syringae group]KPZ23506.1 Uncharacterized protein ALO38_03199 [Pseudomonas coronafaciens pv. zizaniae]MCF5746139.1 hypothetical protein [Pseudomonas tremae]MCQ2990467.1 hypothetical protein [Pseudomonas tremae]QGT81676.1 hypothetical protein GMO17_10985 [Pseudomonas coronafaciens pv. coronafaciens]QIQ74565.1 hypothetical protein HBB04_04986 [Pseudomonas coronafaciens]
MILPKGWVSRKLEAELIRIAARILMGRNVARSPVVSRRDNNDMYYMAEQLEAIADRISRQYP